MEKRLEAEEQLRSAGGAGWPPSGKRALTWVGAERPSPHAPRAQDTLQDGWTDDEAFAQVRFLSSAVSMPGHHTSSRKVTSLRRRAALSVIRTLPGHALHGPGHMTPEQNWQFCRKERLPPVPELR